MDWPTLTSSSTTAGSIANWMNKSSITSGAGGVADTIVQEACSWIYRRLRHWQMLTSAQSVTFPTTNPYITISTFTGFLEPDALWYINGDIYWMTQKGINQVYQARVYNGSGALVAQPPVIFSFNNTNIEFDSLPDQAYQGYLTYYEQLPALSQSNPTNFLTSTYPRLMRLACMAGACEWAKDNGQGNFDRTYYDQLAQAEIENAQAESDRARRGIVNAGVIIGGGDTGFPMYGVRM